MRQLGCLTFWFALLSITPLWAEIDHNHAVLQSVYPAGGCRGTKVEVTFTGYKNGLEGADGLLIDGPPGVTVERFEVLNSTSVKATLAIAEEARPGRRMIRVKGGPTGLTNFRWFFVGTIPEFQESQKNNEREQAETVQTPVVVNGRIEKTLDQDCFRFEAQAGEKLVVAVQSHGLDAMGFDRNTAGFADASLELLDESGRVVAEDGDTLGYDPIIQFEVPSTGHYTARVSGMGYKGFPQFVYRMTIGEVPYPTAIFPPGGRRGEEVEITFTGPNIPPGTKRIVRVDEDRSPVQYISFDGASPDLPFVRSHQLELHPNEPGDQLAKAFSITEWPVVLNGIFDKPGDTDWFRLDLDKGEKIFLDVLAQRHLRSPVDTLLEIYDADGKLLAANDDSELLLSEVNHEFVPFDSQRSFQAKNAGPYFVKLGEQSGAGGPRAVYRLSLSTDKPDFTLYQWPDAVPVWGPGTTAAFVVEIHRFGGLKHDVEISIEGLPDGWTGSTTTAFNEDYRHAFRGAFGHKLFLTLTAPTEIPVGSIAEFRVVGRAKLESGKIVHQALPLSHLTWGEPNRFRAGQTSRAVVARPQGIPLMTPQTEITAKPNASMEIPLILPESMESPTKPVSLSLNRATTHFKCAIGPPIKVTFQNGKGILKVSLPASFKAGRFYDLVVSNAWASETRQGLPGPCTGLIRVHVAE